MQAEQSLDSLVGLRLLCQDLAEELENGTYSSAVAKIFVNRLPDLPRRRSALEGNTNEVRVVVGDKARKQSDAGARDGSRVRCRYAVGTQSNPGTIHPSFDPLVLASKRPHVGE